MGEKEIEVKKLIIKSLLSEISEEENKKLENWIKENESNKLLYNKIIDKQNLVKKINILDSINEEKSFKQIKKNLKTNSKSNKVRLLNLSYKIAASVILMISIFYTTQYFLTETQTLNFKPGENQALLFIEGNEPINLTNKSNENIKVNNTEVKINNNEVVYTAPRSSSLFVKNSKITTPRGGEYKLVLPDGTKVWLNAESEIEFPSDFKGKYRKVKVKGEVFFDVTKNKDKPFIVQLPKYKVMVLGTKFNVNSYQNSKTTHITLCEGKVQVFSSKLSKNVYLEPGMQFNYNKKLNNYTVKEVNVLEFSSWIKGYFYYKDKPLSYIMQNLSRWYDFKIDYDNDKMKNRLFSAKFSRQDNLKTILKVMEEGSGLKFKIKKNTIYVEK